MWYANDQEAVRGAAVSPAPRRAGPKCSIELTYAKKLICDRIGIAGAVAEVIDKPYAAPTSSPVERQEHSGAA